MRLSLIKNKESRISIHALRGEGDDIKFIANIPIRISIHALRGEGDCFVASNVFIFCDFNPRPPWGGRLRLSYVGLDKKGFQSTPSVGRATVWWVSCCRGLLHFNPRPPWGGRPLPANTRSQTLNISIHALRGEGDAAHIDGRRRTRHFNPRPPWGGRPICNDSNRIGICISIHALRGEGDFSASLAQIFECVISIHALRGEGDACFSQITLCIVISIHALRGEGDRGASNEGVAARDFNPRPPWGGRRSTLLTSSCCIIYFNPRPPWGGRRFKLIILDFVVDISIHALRGEGDFYRSGRGKRSTVFQSTPSVGRATLFGDSVIFADCNFNPRPPWGGRLKLSTRIDTEELISIHALRGEGDYFWGC